MIKLWKVFGNDKLKLPNPQNKYFRHFGNVDIYFKIVLSVCCTNKYCKKLLIECQKRRVKCKCCQIPAAFELAS